MDQICRLGSIMEQSLIHYAQSADPIHSAGIVGGGVTKCYCIG
ncbi:unnamed protein product [Staurois parvus]|uniref:Uncharacterized protein n=1 Tax=Staurois parvus TaxID=386267 RepID=A0ABN9EY10_9NEOB|nr:unnamed protein product [Staurois parvus]